MHRKWFAFVGMVLLLAAGTLHAAGPQQDDIEVEDLKLANEAIVLSLASASCPACPSRECPGIDSGELGMAVIGASNSPLSLRALADLVRFRFDGAYSENYDTYLFAKGSRIKNIFRSLKPEELHKQCAHEFAKLQGNNTFAPLIQGVTESQVCYSIEGIKQHIKEWLHDLPDAPGQKR